MCPATTKYIAENVCIICKPDINSFGSFVCYSSFDTFLPFSRPGCARSAISIKRCLSPSKFALIPGASGTKNSWPGPPLSSLQLLSCLQVPNQSFEPRSSMAHDSNIGNIVLRNLHDPVIIVSYHHAAIN